MKVTIKSIEKKYPDYKIVGTSNNRNVYHLPTQGYMCSVLRGCDLSLIEELIKEAQISYLKTGRFDRNKFRPEEQKSIAFTDVELKIIWRQLAFTLNAKLDAANCTTSEELDLSMLTNKIEEAM